MDHDRNLRHVHNQALYPRGFSYSDHGGYDSPEPAHFNAASTAELALPQDLLFEGYCSPVEWVSASSESQELPPMSSSTVAHYGDARARRPSSVSLIKGLQGVSSDNAAVLVCMLAMCVFIGLATWAASAVQGELRDYDIDAVDDADASLHLENSGGKPSAKGVSGREVMKAQDWTVEVIHRQPPKSKRTSPTLHDVDFATTGWEGRPDDDNGYVPDWPVETDEPMETDDEYIGDLTATWTTDVEDITTARSERRVHRGRSTASKKAGRRLSLRLLTKRIDRRRRPIRQDAVPPDDYLVD